VSSIWDYPAGFVGVIVLDTGSPVSRSTKIVRHEAIYNRHRCEREIRIALPLWADYVISIVKRDSNIATLNRA
jgi:hypothetical protein